MSRKLGWRMLDLYLIPRQNNSSPNNIPRHNLSSRLRTVSAAVIATGLLAAIYYGLLWSVSTTLWTSPLIWLFAAIGWVVIVVTCLAAAKDFIATQAILNYRFRWLLVPIVLSFIWVPAIFIGENLRNSELGNLARDSIGLALTPVNSVANFYSSSDDTYRFEDVQEFADHYFVTLPLFTVLVYFLPLLLTGRFLRFILDASGIEYLHRTRYWVEVCMWLLFLLAYVNMAAVDLLPNFLLRGSFIVFAILFLLQKTMFERNVDETHYEIGRDEFDQRMQHPDTQQLAERHSDSHPVSPPKSQPKAVSKDWNAILVYFTLAKLSAGITTIYFLEPINQTGSQKIWATFLFVCLVGLLAGALRETAELDTEARTEAAPPLPQRSLWFYVTLIVAVTFSAAAFPLGCMLSPTLQISTVALIALFVLVGHGVATTLPIWSPSVLLRAASIALPLITFLVLLKLVPFSDTTNLMRLHLAVASFVIARLLFVFSCRSSPKSPVFE